MSDCLGVTGECDTCGSPVLSYLCNSSVIRVRPDSLKEDYWVSCSNITCPNHRGEGYVMNFPSWVGYPESIFPETPTSLHERLPRSSDYSEGGCCWFASVSSNPLRLEWHWDSHPPDHAYHYWLPYWAKYLPVLTKEMDQED